jgi:hypothetical protein
MSLKKNKISLFLFAILLILSSCGGVNDPLDEFEENRPGTVRAFYAYPSTIRMLGKIMGNGNEKALSDVESARLFIEWKSEDANSRDEFLQIRNQSLQYGFEELFTISSKDSDITVLIKDESTPRYLVFSMGSDVDYILELEGTISMATLRDIGTLDIDNVVDVINLGKPSKKDKPEIQENE